MFVDSADPALPAFGTADRAAASGVPVVPGPVPAAHGSASRYGEDRRLKLPMAAGVLLLHVAAFAAVVYLQPQFTKHTAQRVQVFDVKLDSPPQPPDPVPPQRKPDVVELAPAAVAQPIPVLAAAIVPAPASQIVTPKPAVAPPAPPQPAAPAGPATVQAGSLGAQMISGRPPRYPMDSRRNREQGTVLLSLVLGVDGRVTSISIARSSGFRRLDEAAREAVQSWRWAPVIRNGLPAIVRGMVEIPFVLGLRTGNRGERDHESRERGRGGYGEGDRAEREDRGQGGREHGRRHGPGGRSARDGMEPMAPPADPAAD